MRYDAWTMLRLLIILLSVTSVGAQTDLGWASGKYDYDGAGNIKAIGDDAFAYDALGRLVRAKLKRIDAPASWATYEIEYDAWGNIKKMPAPDGAELTFGVDSNTNRASLSDAPANAYGTYDEAGRLKKTVGGDEFKYDGLDAVTWSKVDTTTKVHLYTASGERIASVTVAGSTPVRSDWTLRDTSGKVLRRFEKNGAAWSWEEDYIYAGDRLLASEVSDTGQTLHFHLDHLGTPRLITDQRGGRVALHKYMPFGDEITSPNQDAEKLKFTGHERDGEKLDYMHARYYFPKWGRFLSVDPKSSGRLQYPQSWNRYTYVWSNPLKFVDPDGLDVMLVVRDSGAGTTNFGHVALRVYGDGYDRTYDFGRYGATYPPFKSRGEGILRVWSNFSAFLKTQTKKGDVKVGTWQTTEAFDSAVMAQFAEHMKGAEVRDVNKNFTVYKLTADYALWGLNCTTICLDALASAETATHQALEGFGRIRGQGDPNDVFGEMDAIFGGDSARLLELMTQKVSRWRALGGVPR